MTRQVSTLVIRANSLWDKISTLTELRDSCEEMKAPDRYDQGSEDFKNFRNSSRRQCWQTRLAAGRARGGFGKQTKMAARVFGCLLVRVGGQAVEKGRIT